ncbi:MAG: GAF domain-containing protein [bacterium]|nr:GAF domain-containing protein [bacterium]
MSPEFRNALDLAVLEGLRAPSGTLGALYAVFLVSDLLQQPPRTVVPIAISDSCLIASLLFLRWALGRRRIPARWAHPMGAGMAALLSSNVLLNFFLLDEAYHTCYLLIIVVGVGYFLLSLRWLLLTLGGIWASWAAVAWLAATSTHDFVYYGLALVAASTLAAILHADRLRSFRRLRDLQREERVQSVLFHINRTVSLSSNLKELLETTHLQLGTLFDTSNFFVALYDEKSGRYSFPYYVDEYDQTNGFSTEEMQKSLTDYVRRTGEPLLIDEALHRELMERGEVEMVGTPSPLWLGAPLRIPQGTIGVVAVQSYEDGTLYSRRDLRMLSFVSESIAQAIQRQRGEDTLRRRNRELELLNRVGQQFGVSLDLDQVLVTVLEEVRRLLEVNTCSVWLLNPETGELVCKQSTGPKSEIVRGWRLAPGQGLAGWAAEHGEILYAPDTRLDERHATSIDRQSGREMRSIITAPLRVRQDGIGVLQVMDEKPDRFESADLTLVGSLAGTAAAAIENARLYEQARRDAETREMLLREVNHRVKNNLSAIIGLLYAERRLLKEEGRERYESTWEELISRVRGLAAVHDLLSASEWEPLPLSEVAERVISAALQSLPLEKNVVVEVPPSPVRVASAKANNLGLIINELATNTAKYALKDRETARITVRIAAQDAAVVLEYRDDGPGYPDEVLRLERRHVGLYLVETLANGLEGSVSLRNDRGAVSLVRFSAVK